MTELHKSRPLVWGIFIVFCIVWFYTLAPRTLIPTDEGRYAEMAREMAATGDWITPRLNAIKYFEKPPLQTWMNALTFKLFGLGEWQARLWTGLTGLLGIVLTAYAGQRVFNSRVGFVAGVVLASSFLWSGAAHFNALDMGLSAMMTLTLCALLLAQRKQATPAEQRNWMLACWVGMALAVLSKGLIGIVLPGAVLVLYTLLTRDWALWKRLQLGWGTLLFFAITTPWFVLVSLKNPEFPQFFFIHEHFQRFTSKIHHRAGPLWYFIPLVLVGMLPWLGVLLQSIWRARDEASEGFKPRKMLLIWSGFIFFFFSISSSKLPGYIIPIFPALALLVACYLEKASSKVLMWAAGVMALACAAGLPFAARIADQKLPFEQPFYAIFIDWLIAALAIGLVGSLIAVGLARLRQNEWSIVALGASGFLCMQVLMLGHEPLGTYAAGTIHLPALQAELNEQTPLYAVGQYEQVLPFYLRRTVTLVQHADEMAFGLAQQPELWLPTVDAFVAKWTADRAAGRKSVAIINPAIYDSLLKQGVPMRVIAQDPRRVIVANAPK